MKAKIIRQIWSGLILGIVGWLLIVLPMLKLADSSTRAPKNNDKIVIYFEEL